MLTTGNQLKAARALIELDQGQVAALANVNVNTIRNMESAGSGQIAGRAQTVQLVQRVLENAGIEFLNHGSPGVRLRKRMSDEEVEAENRKLNELMQSSSAPDA
jgi:transcriptional regulator with XRE-family HTH domain